MKSFWTFLFLIFFLGGGGLLVFFVYQKYKVSQYQKFVAQQEQEAEAVYGAYIKKVYSWGDFLGKLYNFAIQLGIKAAES